MTDIDISIKIMSNIDMSKMYNGTMAAQVYIDSHGFITFNPVGDEGEANTHAGMVTDISVQSLYDYIDVTSVGDNGFTTLIPGPVGCPCAYTSADFTVKIESAEPYPELPKEKKVKEPTEFEFLDI